MSKNRIGLLLLALALISGMGRAQSPQYLVLGDEAGSVAQMKQIFGPIRPRSAHLYAFGAKPLEILTRSVPFLRKQVNDAFDLAEKENVPVAFHVDPAYAWGAGLETSPADAPSVKYWNDPQMREWVGFPRNGVLPTRIPRQWFNWGSWDSPAPAVPAFGSPQLLRFVASQMRAGVAQPIAARVARLNRQGRGYLFAGINIGWETSIPINVGVDPKNLPNAVWPVEAQSVRMQDWEANAHLGYASLYWQGWTQQKLDEAAKKKNENAQAAFNDAAWRILHDYNQLLAKIVYDQGIPKSRIYTHEVAVATVVPGIMSTITPPIWVAVNPYSTPGFTLDNKGGAVYNLDEVRKQIKAADPAQNHFAASETYLRGYHDQKAFADILAEQFGGGATIKWLYSAYPTGGTFGLNPKPEAETRAIMDWLDAR